MSSSRAILAALVFACLVAPRPAQAQLCWFSASPGTLNFGSYDPSVGGNTDTTTTFTVSCLGVATLRFTLNAGSGSYTTRQMTSTGTDRLNYNIYQDAGRSIVWGDGTPPSQALVFTTAGFFSANPFTIYGRVPPSQWITAGAYTDNITVTLNY